ncbi:ethanolamine utilization protein EutJ [Desulfosporosinus sp. OT]|uniref:ethanolamine utilization protein EutJ n=1 Tax=Desulfosporosinus sp. OT TaxID=913865 RepID=UPI000223AD95|nr:ethanolamine utilization protein EutJ [Desulfosporosinus sp. OT]EGW39596.1 ethanolamine utilization protein EutJ [Desulfosporosinus sp. OT]
METVNSTFQYCDQLVRDFEKVVTTPILKKSSVYYTGVDLGTAYIVLAVLDKNYQPVAGAYRFASVVKDGMVVDYIGAIRIVKELKQEIEEKLGTELIYAAAALPPGTNSLDSGAIRHVVQGAGFEITNVLDEPTAANAVLKIKDGAIVDIGGGTTGTAILKDGKVIHVDDEPTGGTHFSLVISGAYKMSFEDADQYKRDFKNHRELIPVLRPVIEKVSSIISRHIHEYPVKEIYLVGGTCCLEGIEDIIAKQTNLPTYKPQNPMFVTPLGIALNCTQEIL